MSIRTALVVVDLQPDFMPGGALPVAEGDQLVSPIRDLLMSGRFDVVVATQDWHPRGHISFASSHPGTAPYDSITLYGHEQVLWPDHCVQGTDGADFHPELEVEGAELVLRKGFRRELDSYSAFFENDRSTHTGLAGYLRDRGFERVYLSGLATDYCVGWSALDARREGFEVYLIEDACRGIDLDGSLEKALTAMDEAGIHRVQASAD